MKHMQTIVMGLALALAAACGKSSSAGTGGGGASVDKAAFAALQESVKGGDDFAKTAAAVDKVLGPAKIKTDDKWTWAVDDGNDCWQVRLGKQGDKVGGVSEVGKDNKMAERSYAKCAARAKGTPP